MLQMGKDKDRLWNLNNIQIKISDIEMLDDYTHPISIRSEAPISSDEIDILKRNPWILLQLCATHFDDFVYEKKIDVTDAMFFLESEIDDVWLLIKKLFRKSLFFTTRVEPDNTLIYKVDITGVSAFGEIALKTLSHEGIIPTTWKELYLTERYPLVEEEGMYFFTDLPSIKENQGEEDDVMSRLLTNPFFRSMEIPTISLADCEKNDCVQKILRKSKMAIIFVEEMYPVFTKRICWKYD